MMMMIIIIIIVELASLLDRKRPGGWVSKLEIRIRIRIRIGQLGLTILDQFCNNFG